METSYFVWLKTHVLAFTAVSNMVVFFCRLFFNPLVSRFVSYIKPVMSRGRGVRPRHDLVCTSSHGAQPPPVTVGPRPGTVSPIRHMALLMPRTRHIGRHSIPTTVGSSSQQRRLETCYCFFQKVTSVESSAHLAYNTRVFHPHTHYEWNQYGPI